MFFFWGIGNQAVLLVPDPTQGKSKRTLEDAIKDRCNKFTEAGVNSIVINLHDSCDWPFDKFLKTILQGLKELYEAPQAQPKPVDVVFAVRDENMFHRANTTMDVSGR